MTDLCGAKLRSGKACGRPSLHAGQHRTATAAARRNRRKRQDTKQAALIRDLAGIPDGRKTWNMSALDYARSTGIEPAEDDYLARKRSAGLID